MSKLSSHYSTSSSVYSPIESEFTFGAQNRSSVIQEEDEDQADATSDRFGSDFDESSSHRSSIHSYSSRPGGLIQENSENTFHSYHTANSSAPSFTSINNSLLHVPSSDSLSPGADPDQTPKLDLAYRQPDTARDDETPIVGSNGFPNDSLDFTESPPPFSHTPVLSSNHPQDSYASLRSSSNSDVQQKFQRLSVTLLQSGVNVSRESNLFHSNFSLNAHRANSYLRTSDTRTSAYYNKILSKAGKKHDQSSETSLRNSSSERDSISDEIPPRKDLLPLSQKTAPGLHIIFDEPNTSVDTTGTSETMDNLATNHADVSAATADTEDVGLMDDKRISVASSTLDDEDMSTLFIKALHSFDATQSQLESETSVCLSFEKNDLAFVHTIDDSGWGEVTLLETLERGWIPMNYFSMAINLSPTAEEAREDTYTVEYSRYMAPLLHACGKFLLNPLSHTNSRNKMTFSVKRVNSIRDGVRLLLQETDCLSRSNEIVIKKPLVRKARKALLSDWYNLMLKASEFKNTSNFEKIEILTLLILQVIRRASSFFEKWVSESNDIIKRDTENKLQTDMSKYPLLESPPLAKQRVTEINGILYSYLSLIMGRLDLVEHNPQGCEVLEIITHHIILLLRELLFISKTGSDYFSEKPTDLDTSLDALLSLVSECVTAVKSLYIKTMGEDHDAHNAYAEDDEPKVPYSFSEEGQNLIQIASRMVKAIGSTILSIKKLFDIIGDYKLSSERSYPDYFKMRITPDEFISRCSVGMVNSLSIKNKDLREMKKRNSRNTNRYSMFRSGVKGGLGITPNGVELLHKVMIVDAEEDPFSSSNAAFKPFISNLEVENETFTIKDELLIDAQGNLLGASFKGLIYTLTNEDAPPEYFFVSTFFICFRSFSNAQDLLELLVTRFDACNKYIKEKQKADALLEVRLKRRRKLICKVFQVWMESYWDYKLDTPLLSTLINFFNEGVYEYLPMELMKLIDIAAKVFTKRNKANQIIYRNVMLAKPGRKDSVSDKRKSDNSSRYSMVDGYELSKINTNSSVVSSIKSMTLPMPLGVNGQTSSSSSLLLKSQTNTVESVVIAYRLLLSENWCPKAYCIDKQFHSIDIKMVLPKWFVLCEQNWVLSNYRPNLLDFNGLELAKQLTLIESRIFCSIAPIELLNENYTSKKAHLRLAPNVRQSLLFTNCLSEYVLESILQPDITPKMRVNMIKTWLKVAISCLYLRNFNSLAAIVTSLQSHLITRLTKLWEELSEKYTELFEYLSGVIHPHLNFGVYRGKLRGFLLASDSTVPIVPYFSLFLQDLTFVTDGNPNYRKANTFLNQKLVNIDKYLKITRIIADIESLQVSYYDEHSHKRRSRFSFGLGKNTDEEDYSIQPVPALQELILLELWKITQLNKKEEDRAWKLSCTVQPREASG